MCGSGDGERVGVPDEGAVCSAVAGVGEVMPPGRGGCIVRGRCGTPGMLAGREGSDDRAGGGSVGVRVEPLRGPAFVVPIHAAALGNFDHGAHLPGLDGARVRNLLEESAGDIRAYARGLVALDPESVR